MAQALDKELTSKRVRNFDNCCPFQVVEARYVNIHADGLIEREDLLTVKGSSQDSSWEISGVVGAPGEIETSWLRLTTTLAMQQSEDWLRSQRYYNLQTSE